MKSVIGLLAAQFGLRLPMYDGNGRRLAAEGFQMSSDAMTLCPHHSSDGVLALCRIQTYDSESSTPSLALALFSHPLSMIPTFFDAPPLVSASPETCVSSALAKRRSSMLRRRASLVYPVPGGTAAALP